MVGIVGTERPAATDRNLHRFEVALTREPKFTVRPLVRCGDRAAFNEETAGLFAIGEGNILSRSGRSDARSTSDTRQGFVHKCSRFFLVVEFQGWQSHLKHQQIGWFKSRIHLLYTLKTPEHQAGCDEQH